MGQYRLQEYRCIMLKVPRYSDILLLKSIEALVYMYMTTSNKIVPLGINPRV